LCALQAALCNSSERHKVHKQQPLRSGPPACLIHCIRLKVAAGVSVCGYFRSWILIGTHCRRASLTATEVEIPRT
ncbi:hypothetical protein AAFF_G00317120, partial [Aldrovandia affinis]